MLGSEAQTGMKPLHIFNNTPKSTYFIFFLEEQEQSGYTYLLEILSTMITLVLILNKYI